jgi:hypothetical protein
MQQQQHSRDQQTAVGDTNSLGVRYALEQGSFRCSTPMTPPSGLANDSSRAGSEPGVHADPKHAFSQALHAIVAVPPRWGTCCSWLICAPAHMTGTDDPPQHPRPAT